MRSRRRPPRGRRRPRARGAPRRHGRRSPRATRALTYAELDERSNRLAQALLERGRPARARASRTSTAPRRSWSSCSSRRARSERSPSRSTGASLRPSSGRRRTTRAAACSSPARRTPTSPGSSPQQRRAGPSWSSSTARHRLRGAARRAGADRPGRARRARRRRPAAVHVGHDGRAQGRADDAQEPDRRGRDVAALGVRRRLGEPHAAADVPHRRDRLGVPRPLERRDDDPRPRLRRRATCSNCSSASASRTPSSSRRCSSC